MQGKETCVILVYFILTANADQIDKAKEIIKKLGFTFSSEAFENPVIQKYWRNIEALALDKDAPEEFQDFTCKCFMTCTCTFVDEVS